MLRTLTIRDFAIVDELEIDLAPGFSVFSGETGAGKSILIDALTLALGERGDPGVLRDGAARTEISASFDADGELRQRLGDEGLALSEGILLRRQLDSGGRSKAWINGTPVTLKQLRDFGALLIDIHGQHAYQALLRADAQRALLDAQAGAGELVTVVANTYREWQSARSDRARAENDRHAVEAERQRMADDVDELERLAQAPGEWDALQLDQMRLSNAASLIEGCQQLLAGMTEDDTSVQAKLGELLRLQRQLERIDPTLHGVRDALEPALIDIQEAARALSAYLSRIDLDPDRLAQVDARMASIHAAARKFRVAPADLDSEHGRLAARLAELKRAVDVEAMLVRESVMEAHFRECASQLSKLRLRVAPDMQHAISAGMTALGMAHGRIEIRVSPTEPSAQGLESVEFWVAIDAGAAPRPLAAVASGGELSRISLAIAVVANAATSVPTLIFDEVDSGIGGAVAEIVGRLLRQLGNTRQVLCVTHLPQVAACGEHHFAVRKVEGMARVASQVQELDAAARVEELARMLGGVEITPTTRRHAREMLAGAA